MNLRRASILLAGLYLLAQAVDVTHPYEHDAHSGSAEHCAICDALASTKGTGAVAEATVARDSPIAHPVVYLVSQISRIVPSAYAPRAPPSL